MEESKGGLSLVETITASGIFLSTLIQRMIFIRLLIAANNRQRIPLKYTHKIILQVVLRTRYVHAIQ